MGIELQNTCLDGFQTVLEQVFVHEETLESIVPDACPDIMRVVTTVGEVCLKSRELSDGSLRVGGSIRAEVLYIPDGEEGPRRMEVRMPFLCSVDDPRLHRDCRIMAAPRLWEIETRIINPRKVLVRAQITLDTQIFASRKLELCSQAVCQPDQGLQKRSVEQKIYLATDVQEKSFTFSDVINLPHSKPAAEELLCSRVEPRTLDARVIGSKLILKGEAALHALYRDGNGEVNSVQFELPFSQIIELTDGEESSDVWVWTVLTSSGCTLQLGEPGSLAVSLEFLAQAVVRSTKQVALVTDLYCTRCPVEAEYSETAVEKLVDQGVIPQEVRQFCPCSIPVWSVQEITFTPGKLNWQEGGSGVSITADARVCVLFRSEDGILYSVTCPVPVTCTLPAGRWSAHCLGASELTAAPVNGGLEIRFQAEFSYLVLEQTSCSVVSGVRPLAKSEQEGTLRPSVVLRVVSEGEALWDVAKSCCATVADIMAVNELEQEYAPVGTMLLIPRQR